MAAIWLSAIGAALAIAVPSQRATSVPQGEAVVAEPAASLQFGNDIMAQRPGDPRLYVLLGSGFLRPFTTRLHEAFVPDWLRRHPRAMLIPVSRLRSTNTISHLQQEIVYVWIEDGPASLNVDLVSAGIYMGSAMIDMVDNRRALDALLERDPKLADTREAIRKERAAAPHDGDERLVSDDIYKAHLARFEAAEGEARAARRGIWSDAMRDERTAEGVR